MDVLTTLESLARSTGIKAIIGRFATEQIDYAPPQGEINNSPEIPKIQVVKIDEIARRYLLSRHYGRRYFFTVLSSEAKQDMPDLDSQVESFRNEENNALNLHLIGGGFSATAECTFYNPGYDLRVSNVVAKDG